MIDRTAFSRGLTRIATVIRRAVDDATLEFYFEPLERDTTAEEWEAFSRAMADEPPWEEIPTLEELRRELGRWRMRTGRLNGGGLPALPAVRKPETPAEVAEWRAGIQAGMDKIRAEMASRGMPLDQVVHRIPMPGKRARKRRKS